FSKKNFNFPIIQDEAQVLVKRYQALKTPFAVILEKQQDQTYKTIYQGGVSDQRDFTQSKAHFLDENLKALSQGKTVKYAVGQSLGCYIRRL
ncbi:MAG: hypothetical protein KDD34_08565, partial [Bdellovibrionales bacterium]|nr:hypothetical protein [Bdellovibrionales bacterium]